VWASPERHMHNMKPPCAGRMSLLLRLRYGESAPGNLGQKAGKPMILENRGLQ
jgi:hypothetical protein